MAIFGIIEIDPTVQENEKVRIDCTKSFITADEDPITSLEIEPHTGDGFINVFGANASSYYLDWIYPTDGIKTISLKITTTLLPVPVVSTITKDITVVTAVDDALFASDADLQAIETDVMKWVPKGKSTWNFVHRKVQDKILTELYKSQILATDGTKLTKDEVIDKAEVREWATYLALSIIFYSISNSVDDIFARKAMQYGKNAAEYMNYSMNVLALDYNKSGDLTSSEKLDFRSASMVRR